MDTSIAPPSVYRKRKRWAIWALAGIGVLHGLLYAYGLSHPATQMGLEFFMTFTCNLALLGWCYVDAEERKIPITRWLGLALLAVSLIGVPWYFIRSRGLWGAVKGGFGLGLLLLYGSLMLTVSLIVELVTGR